MRVPSAAKRNKPFTVSADLVPAYSWPTAPVTFYVQRKSGRTYKPYRSKVALMGAGSTSTRCSASFALPKGTFRIRAKFLDAAHRKGVTNKFKAVQVK